MKIYNSLTNNEQKLTLDFKKPFNLYACGPTVYNYIHLGNARPSFMVDFLVRFLEFEGYQVNYLQNITDIDDKIIQQALETKTNELELSNFYGDQYLADLQKMNIRQPNKIIKVSESIPEIVKFIETLIANQSAYLIDGDVYFDVKKYQNEYGKLSGRKISDLENFVDLEPNEKKHDPLDFAL
jgi:cysteinyl-tRNA synthetase